MRSSESSPSPRCLQLWSRYVQVPPDGVVMDARPDCNKKMPDGVGEWDESVALKEDHAHHVEDPPKSQLTHTRTVHL